jgi:N6-adenosine-specific RNA methylase IME4
VSIETVMYPVKDIVVPRGRRKVNEDRVKELAESIEEIGQLQPIVLAFRPAVEELGKAIQAEHARLVAGFHRLSAFRMLERPEILAIVRDFDDLDSELAEIDENLIREDLTPAERAKLTARRKAIYLVKYPDTKHGGDRRSSEFQDDKLAPCSFGDDTSTKSSKSKRTVERDSRRGEKVDGEILDAIAGTDLDTGINLDTLARLKPEKQKEVVDYAKKKGLDNLKAAKKALTKDKSIKDIEGEPAPLPEGPFRVISADPPWPYDRTDDETHRGSITYHKMSIAQICGLPVGEMAHDDCILFLWTTNAFMREAYQVLDAWGFEEKTILTWCKPKLGVGNWLRNQTEHCILAVRGKPVVKLTNQTTILVGKVREHSRKPESFYKLVNSLCPGSKVELFSREERKGWSRWGSETKFDESSQET